MADKSNCFEAGGPVTIVFTDDSEISLPNDNDVKCSTEGLLNIGGHHKHNEVLDQLRQKLVKSMRMSTNNGSVESVFTPENQVMFRDVINCIAEKL